MIVASTWLVMRVEQKADEIDEDSSTPADFTVFVRNLPKDVSEGALVAHFSMRYNIHT
jgi:RNA recognition motif-containing protein